MQNLKKVSTTDILSQMQDDLLQAEMDVRNAQDSLAKLKFDTAKKIVSMNSKVVAAFLARKINSRDFRFFTQRL